MTAFTYLADVAASAQETIIHAVSKRCLGSLYLFEPDEYRKGNATREPADLAWWCRDLLVLIAMQAGSTSYKSQTSHNLGQLRGFMRLWDRGIASLAGVNDWHNLQPEPDGHEDIVLLSVVSCEDARAEVHRDEPTVSGRVGSRVTLIASLPQEVLVRLAQRGGSALDLADLLLRVDQHSGGVSAAEALKFVEEHFEAAAQRARVGRRPDRDSQLDMHMQRMIIDGFRTALQSATYNADAEKLRGLSIFSDIDHETTTTLAMLLSDLYRQVRDVPVGEVGPQFVIGQIESPPYAFVVAVGDMRQAKEMGSKASEIFHAAEADGLCPIAINQMLVGRPAVQFSPMLVALSRQVVPSAAAATLRAAGTPNSPSNRERAQE